MRQRRWWHAILAVAAGSVAFAGAPHGAVCVPDHPGCAGSRTVDPVAVSTRTDPLPPGVAYRIGADDANAGSFQLHGSDRRDGAAADTYVQPGTTVATARLANGGGVYAYHDSRKHQLGIVDSDRAPNLSDFAMVPGTSPAVAGLPGGGYVVVFQRADDGLLWARSASGALYRPGGSLELAPRTDPSVAALPGGGFVIAFQGRDGHLWYVDEENRGHRTGWQVAAGSGPSVAPVPGGYAIAFTRAEDGRLWVRSAGGAGVDHGVAVAPGTDPDIASFPGGGYIVAYQCAGTGTVCFVDAAGNTHDTTVGIDAGTSPAVVTGGFGAWQIAFNDRAHAVRVVDQSAATLHVGSTGPGDGVDISAIVPPDGGYLLGIESNRCLVPVGPRVVLWSCDGEFPNGWTRTVFDEYTMDGSVCLDAEEGGTADGTPVVARSCNGSTGQRWARGPMETIINVASGKCLDVTGHGRINGTPVQLWTCTSGAANQRWYGR